MKEYKLVFKPLSTITNIPNAQTIFGAICNIIVNTQGEEALNNYISSFNNQPLFIHSSMFPLNMLPMVHYNIFDIDYINHNILKEKSIDQLSYLQTLKNYKKINYTTESIFNDYIIKSDFNKMRDDLLNKKINIKNYCLQKASENILFEQTKQLNTHVRKKDYYNTSIGDDNALYYDDTIYTNGLFYILVKTNENIKKIKDIFSYSHFFGFGPRHSVGKNSFKLISIEEIKRKPNLNNKLLLSQSVFDECINLSESNYQIISKQYHPSKTYINKTRNESNDFLFPGKHSLKPLSEQSVRLVIKRIVEQNNFSRTITPHMFRHSFATMLLDSDVDIRYIQQILGHSSISITQIYTHVSHSKQKEILSSFNPVSVIHSEIE